MKLVFLSIFTILFALNGAAQTLFGGVEIGSKGVKVGVLSFQRSYSGKIWFHPEFDRTKNTDVISGTTSAINETAFAVKNFSDSIKQQFKLSKENILIVISSGAMQELRKKDKVGDLAIAIRTALGDMSQKIYFVTPEEEGFLTAAALIPRKELETAAVIDIGSGNTKGGYFSTKDYKGFEAFTFPYGTKTITKAVKATNPEGFTGYSTNLSQYFQKTIQPELQEEVDRKPALSNRNTVYLSGGIVWAIHTTMHPERINDEYSSLTAADVSLFKQKVNGDYNKLFDINTNVITDKEIAAEAQKNITNVKNTFDRESLLAGSTLLEQVIKDIEQQTGRKNYQFYKYSSWSWLSSFILIEYFDKIK